MNYRSKIPNANKHPYLFVTHRKGKTQGNPISTSSFDNVIVPTMKKIDPKFSIIHPHIFRHEWNLDFSRKVDKNNQNINHDFSQRFYFFRKRSKDETTSYGAYIREIRKYL